MTKRKATTISLFDLMQQYPTEESAFEYFEQNRWGNKPICVKCGCEDKITKQKKLQEGLLVRELPGILQCLHQHTA